MVLISRRRTVIGSQNRAVFRFKGFLEALLFMRVRPHPLARKNPDKDPLDPYGW
jgi:hypothetical protein